MVNNPNDDLTYFLTQHKDVMSSYDLFTLIDQSVLLINEIFDDYKLKFTFDIDPETGEAILFLIIETNLGIKEALDILYKFEDKWFSICPPEILCIYNITV